MEEIRIDAERGHRLAGLLHRAFSSDGIHGQRFMPEDTLPEGIEEGSLEHLLFITLTVSIDYQRDALALWESARRTYEDEGTRYLFEPRSLHETDLHRISDDMRRYGLSKKLKKDAYIWRTVGATFHMKWDGDPRNFLEDCSWDAPRVLERLRSDTHLQNGRYVPDYPYLRGAKIGPLWLRMLRDNVGIEALRCIERVPIPVDIHVARATLATGVVSGRYRGPLEELFGHIREAWSKSVEGLEVEGRGMVALDVDEPLWHLSRYGCTFRDAGTGECSAADRCEAREFCIEGPLDIKNGYVTMGTGRPTVTEDVSEADGAIAMTQNDDGQIFCFIPCCKSKHATGEVTEPKHALSPRDLPHTWDRLVKGRASMEWCLYDKSPLTTALSLYRGSFYLPFRSSRGAILDMIGSGRLRVFILSAGYGLIDAMRPVQDYDAALQGDAAGRWREHGLDEIIADLLVTTRPSQVYGFFAGKEDWSYPGSKYRYFFMKGLRKAIERGYSPDSCGCVYRKEGRGPRAILGALGRAFAGFIDSGLDPMYPSRIRDRGIVHGNVVIGYDGLIGGRSPAPTEGRQMESGIPPRPSDERHSPVRSESPGIPSGGRTRRAGQGKGPGGVTVRETIRTIIESEGHIKPSELFRRVNEMGVWKKHSILRHILGMTVNLWAGHEEWPQFKENDRVLFQRGDGWLELYDVEKHGRFSHGMKCDD